LNVLLLIKPVASQSLADGSRSTKEMSINMADGAAFSFTINQKKNKQDKIVLLSMVHNFPNPQLKKLCSYPFDSIYQICDSLYAGSDTLITSKILAKATKYIEKDMKISFDVVACGNRSTDSETAQVPCEVASFLELPVFTNCISVKKEKKNWKIIRLLEQKTLEYSFENKCVISFCPKGSELDPPSLFGMSHANEVPFIKIDNTQLKFDKNLVGLKGSPTKVVRSIKVQQGLRESILIEDPKEGATIIWKEIRKIQKTKESSLKKKVLPLTKVSWGTPAFVVCPVSDELAWKTSLQILGKLTLLGFLAQALVLGSVLSQTKKDELTTSGTRKITKISVDKTTDDRLAAEAIVRFMQETTGILLFGATVKMRSIAPLCAAKLSCGLCADCTDLKSLNNGKLLYIRPAFGESLEAQIEVKSPLAIATIRPNAFANYLFMNSKIEVEKFSFISQLNFLEAEEVKIPLDNERDERIMFSLGDGIKEKELRDQIDNFGFAKGASRQAVNHYVVPYVYQVGLTGKIVKPQLYVAFGISGSEQHLVGIKQTKTIISVNIDRIAPIFDYSDYAICCDVKQVVEALEIEKELKNEL